MLLDHTLFLWCHGTAGLNFETGIQRVVRRLGLGLAQIGIEVVPVGWDALTRNVKVLGAPGDDFEQRIARRKSGSTGKTPWLLVPELSMDLAASNLDPVQIAQAYGLRSAAFLHDLIPLKLRNDYDTHFVALFQRYVAMFSKADVVITTTHYVANDLRAYLDQIGLYSPPIVTVPLPAQFADHQRCLQTKPQRAPGAPLYLVTVSTWEPRKNLPRLLRAIRDAERQRPSQIRLTAVGQRGHFKNYDAEVEKIIADMPGVTVTGIIDDKELAAIYASSDASFYPSVEEGFGLPIGESLWLATPCVCHSGSAMAEVAPGGGTLLIDMTNEDALTDTLVSLAVEPKLLARLSEEARNRPLTSWGDYAAAVAVMLAV